jgi:Tetratricopeptide repeat
LQFSISNAYARRDARAQVRRGLSRALRVWWSGIGCGIVPVSAVLIAVAYEKVAHDQETEWDFAEDCLVTHGPPGMLNIATGVLGLAAMLWLYGVAWHQPMADSFSWVRAGIASVAHMSSDSQATPVGGSGKISALPSPAPSVAMPTVSVGNAVPGSPSTIGSASTASVDPDVTALMAERRAKIGALKAEGPRMLAAGNWRRAAEICRDWTDLDLGTADAWRCLGQAQQALGNYNDALHAFRRAKQYDPNDRALDAAIERAQRGIISEFLARYRR